MEGSSLQTHSKSFDDDSPPVCLVQLTKSKNQVYNCSIDAVLSTVTDDSHQNEKPFPIDPIDEEPFLPLEISGNSSDKPLDQGASETVNCPSPAVIPASPPMQMSSPELPRVGDSDSPCGLVIDTTPMANSSLSPSFATDNAGGTDQQDAVGGMKVISSFLCEPKLEPTAVHEETEESCIPHVASSAAVLGQPESSTEVGRLNELDGFEDDDDGDLEERPLTVDVTGDYCDSEKLTIQLDSVKVEEDGDKQCSPLLTNTRSNVNTDSVHTTAFISNCSAAHKLEPVTLDKDVVVDCQNDPDLLDNSVISTVESAAANVSLSSSSSIDAKHGSSNIISTTSTVTNSKCSTRVVLSDTVSSPVVVVVGTTSTLPTFVTVSTTSNLSVSSSCLTPSSVSVPPANNSQSLNSVLVPPSAQSSSAIHLVPLVAGCVPTGTITGPPGVTLGNMNSTIPTGPIPIAGTSIGPPPPPLQVFNMPQFLGTPNFVFHPTGIGQGTSTFQMSAPLLPGGLSTAVTGALAGGATFNFMQSTSPYSLLSPSNPPTAEFVLDSQNTVPFGTGPSQLTVSSTSTSSAGRLTLLNSSTNSSSNSSATSSAASDALQTSHLSSLFPHVQPLAPTASSSTFLIPTHQSHQLRPSISNTTNLVHVTGPQMATSSLSGGGAGAATTPVILSNATPGVSIANANLFVQPTQNTFIPSSFGSTPTPLLHQFAPFSHPPQLQGSDSCLPITPISLTDWSSAVHPPMVPSSNLAFWQPPQSALPISTLSTPLPNLTFGGGAVTGINAVGSSVTNLLPRPPALQPCPTRVALNSRYISPAVSSISSVRTTDKTKTRTSVAKHIGGIRAPNSVTVIPAYRRRRPVGRPPLRLSDLQIAPKPYVLKSSVSSSSSLPHRTECSTSNGNGCIPITCVSADVPVTFQITNVTTPVALVNVDLTLPSPLSTTDGSRLGEAETEQNVIEPESAVSSTPPPTSTVQCPSSPTPSTSFVVIDDRQEVGNFSISNSQLDGETSVHEPVKSSSDVVHPSLLSCTEFDATSVPVDPLRDKSAPCVLQSSPTVTHSSTITKRDSSSSLPTSSDSSLSSSTSSSSDNNFNDVHLPNRINCEQRTEHLSLPDQSFVANLSKETVVSSDDQTNGRTAPPLDIPNANIDLPSSVHHSPHDSIGVGPIVSLSYMAPPLLHHGPDDRRILTHFIDGHIIYESNKPFPVKHGMAVVEAALLHQCLEEADETNNPTAYRHMDGNKRKPTIFPTKLSWSASEEHHLSRKNINNNRSNSKESADIEAMEVVTESDDQSTELGTSTTIGLNSDHVILQNGYQDESKTGLCESSDHVSKFSPPHPTNGMDTKESIQLGDELEKHILKKSSCAENITTPVVESTDRFLRDASPNGSGTTVLPIVNRSNTKRLTGDDNRAENRSSSITTSGHSDRCTKPNSVADNSDRVVYNTATTTRNMFSTPSATTRLTPTTPTTTAFIPTGLAIPQIPAPPPPGPVRKWSPDDVVSFVRGTPGCSAYASAFLANEIDGEALLLLAEDEFIQPPIGMKVGPALKLAARLDSLRNLS